MIKEKLVSLKNTNNSKKNYQNFKAFNKYLEENKIFYKSKKISKNNILVTDFVSTPGYMHTSGVIGKYLAKKIDGGIFSLISIEIKSGLKPEDKISFITSRS